MLYPDNFLYFITLFFVATSLGTYLLLSYNRSHLIILNAILFYLIAIRACTEYYLPQMTDYETVENIALFHSLILLFWAIIMWYTLWAYIRPFRGFKWEKRFNLFYYWGVLFVPLIPTLYLFYNRISFTMYPEPIDGYWRYSTNSEIVLVKIYLFYSYIFLPVINYSILFIDIIRNKKQRFQKLVVWFFLVFILPLMIQQIIFQSTGKFRIPNFAFTHLLQTIILSWFISEYRLFKDGFDEAKKDLLNSISDYAISTDLQLKITHANEQVRQLLKVDHQPIVSLITDFSQATAQQMNTKIQQLIQFPEQALELSLDIPDAGIKTFTCRVAPFKRGNQKVGYTFLLKDLTLIREKEKELAATNELKDRLFDIIGHDLRKPSLAFRNIGQKINYLIQTQDFKRLSRLGHTIEKNALSMNKLIDNLLNWALLKKNIVAYELGIIHLESVTNETLLFFNAIIEEKQLTVHIDFKAGDQVQADLQATKTILRNLIDNALKYTPSCGEIFIATQSDSECVTWVIKDTGLGIAPNKLTQLFQLQKGKSEAGADGEKGTGLGLYLVQELVQLNKGQISVTSEVNKGTTFKVTLPK